MTRSIPATIATWCGWAIVAAYVLGVIILGLIAFSELSRPQHGEGASGWIVIGIFTVVIKTIPVLIVGLGLVFAGRVGRADPVPAEDEQPRS